MLTNPAAVSAVTHQVANSAAPSGLDDGGSGGYKYRVFRATG